MTGSAPPDDRLREAIQIQSSETTDMDCLFVIVGTAQSDDFDSPCPVLFPKIFPFSFDPNQIYNPRCLVPCRGVSRSSRTRGGMRWTRQRRARIGNRRAGSPVSDQRRADERSCGGRQSRVVLAPVAGVKLAEASRPDRA